MSQAGTILVSFAAVVGVCEALSAGPRSAEAETAAACEPCRAVYPLFGDKAGSRELLGAAVSIGDGYFLTASHALNDHREKYRSMGRWRKPGLSIETRTGGSEGGRKALRLHEMKVPGLSRHDIAVLRMTDSSAANTVEVSRPVFFAPRRRAARLACEIRARGMAAVLVGFGVPELPYFGDRLARRKLPVRIYSEAETKTRMQRFRLFSTEAGNGPAEDADPFATRRLLLTAGSSLRFPVANDSGGGLFVTIEGESHLVGIHTRVIHGRGEPPLTYGVFENLFRAGGMIADAIEQDRKDHGK